MLARLWEAVSVWLLVGGFFAWVVVPLAEGAWWSWIVAGIWWGSTLVRLTRLRPPRRPGDPDEIFRDGGLGDG